MLPILRYWYGLHVDDVAGYGAISSVKLSQNGSSDYNIICDKSNGPSFWICHLNGHAPLTAPLGVALVDSAGRLLTSQSVITNLGGGQSFDFGKNFDPIS